MRRFGITQSNIPIKPIEPIIPVKPSNSEAILKLSEMLSNAENINADLTNQLSEMEEIRSKFLTHHQVLVTEAFSFISR